MVGKKGSRERDRVNEVKNRRDRANIEDIRREPEKSSEGASDDRIQFTRPPPVPVADTKNYSIIDLDEPNVARSTWRSSIQQFRLWSYNSTSDRYHFGHERRRSCMLPERGHFLFYMHYHNKWMCAVIEASTGYLVGYITRSVGQDIRVQENARKPTNLKVHENYVKTKGLSKHMQERALKGKYIEGAARLPWTGCYTGCAKRQLGYTSFVNSFNCMHRRIEGTQPVPIHDDTCEAGDVMTLHLPESGRSDKVRRKADRNFLTGIDVGEVIEKDAQNWSGRTNKILAKMLDTTPNKWEVKKGVKTAMQEPQWVSQKYFGPELHEELEILEDLRVLYRVSPVNAKFYLKDMPIQLNWQGAVTGEDDLLKNSTSQENKLSKFLIQPFLPFSRSDQAKKTSENDQTDDISDRGVSPENQTAAIMENCMTILEEKQDSSTEIQSRNDDFHTSMMEQDREEELQWNNDMMEQDREEELQRHNKRVQSSTMEVDTVVATPDVSNDAVKYTHHVVSYDTHMVSEGQMETNQGSAGICNIGNVCYANSGLQYLHCVPDLKTVLDECISGGRNDWVDTKSYNLISALHEVLTLLDQSIAPIDPEDFMTALREKFPVFQQKEIHETSYRQQDVAELIVLLLSMLSDIFGIEASGSCLNPIRNLFGIEQMNRVYYTEEVVYNLDCSIDETVDHLEQGLALALQIHDSVLTGLPTYLTIQVDRVRHDGESGKTLRNVDYPVELDVYNLCSEELQKVLKNNKEGSLTGAQSSGTADVDQAKTGIFDLIGVVTHEGETGNSGHYVMFAKQNDGQWIQFDDSVKRMWKQEDVLNLCGGGGSMAHICLYKAKVA